MSWRVAKSLLVLRDQINTLAPKRNKAADGTVGDLAHQRTKSEHNPDGNGVVRAMDITNDPAGGCNAKAIVDALVASRDPRIMYLIWDYRIVSATVNPWEWRKYSGSNPHNHHFHLSVVSDPKLYDSEKPWALNGELFVPDPKAPTIINRPVLRRGSRGDTVKVLQRLLTGLVADGDFGPKTEQALREFQKRNGLVPDGICGPYTWAKIIP